MGNSKNRIARNKQKISKKPQGLNKSDVKENIPKKQNSVITKYKPDPNDSITMSKQLLKKRTNVRSKESKCRTENRVCGNGKPIPSLADLEKMFEDSDEDEQSPNTTVKQTCRTPSPQIISPKKAMPESLSENKLLSPGTISKISEKLLDMISNISDPIELLDNAPPPPIIPPKKRKKPDVPYIVGCKDRPQVIKKPNYNFCKGDEKYGIQESGDPEEPPTKRAKKSKIPKYSKSIFNANSDEIAARLARDETGGLSDASSDSNKTIEYDPTPYRCQSIHRFSPLPSTSKDNETFMKNDKLFNDSLLENNVIEDPMEKQDEVQIIDTPHETIVIDGVIENHNTAEVQNTSEINNTEIQFEKPIALDDDIEIHQTNNDDDCVLVPNSTNTNNHNNYNTPIDIDDEYSTINIDNITFNNTEIIEVIDIDDVIAENKAILDKWKSDGEQLDKINKVVNVPETYRNSTTPQTGVTPSVNHNLGTSNLNNEINSQITQNNKSLASIPNLMNVDLTSSRHNSIPANRNISSSIQNVVTDFFQNNYTAPRTKTKSKSKSRNCMKTIIDSVFEAFRRVQATATQPVTNILLPPTHISSHQIEINNISSCPNTITLTQETNTMSSNIANDNYLSATGEGFLRRANSIEPTQHSTPFARKSKATARSKTARLQPPIQTDLLPSPQRPESARNLGECPICMDPFSGNGIASTLCGHVFCLQCIKAAIKANGKRCPTCRKALKGAGGGYHQLYL